MRIWEEESGGAFSSARSMYCSIWRAASSWRATASSSGMPKRTARPTSRAFCRRRFWAAARDCELVGDNGSFFRGMKETPAKELDRLV